MSIAQGLLPELEQEAATTRKYIQREPADKLEYRPDPKSMTLGRLAQHIVEMFGWGTITLQSNELELAGFKPEPLPTPEGLLAQFEKNYEEFKAALAQATDAQLMEPWSLKMNGHTIFTLPRVVVLRSMVLNHIVHHRGQLSVYYRLSGVPVPATYGPSADEAN